MSNEPVKMPNETIKMSNDTLDEDLFALKSEELLHLRPEDDSYCYSIADLSSNCVFPNGSQGLSVYSLPQENPIEEHVTNEESYNQVTSNFPIVESTGELPCVENFDGPFGFSYFLDRCQGNTWLFSEALQQVFIKMKKNIIVNFKTDNPLDGDFYYIRALLTYSSSDYISTPVERCAIHSMEDDPNFDAHKFDGCCCTQFQNVGHVIRSESGEAEYCYDVGSKRHSVRTPFRWPQAGSNSFSVPYIFFCKTSCTRGMQRRPVQIIFTLETKDFQVVGRKILHVKICSSPKRDKERQEKDFLAKKETEAPKSGKRKIEPAKDQKQLTKKIKLEIQSPPSLPPSPTTNVQKIEDWKLALLAEVAHIKSRCSRLEQLLSQLE